MDILFVLSMLVTRFKWKLILKYLKYSADFNSGRPFLLCHGYWGCPLLFSKVPCHCALHCQKCKICPAVRTSLARLHFCYQIITCKPRMVKYVRSMKEKFLDCSKCCPTKSCIAFEWVAKCLCCLFNLLHTRLLDYTLSSSCFQQACKPQSYASSQLRPTYRPRGCRVQSSWNGKKSLLRFS